MRNLMVVGLMAAMVLGCAHTGPSATPRGGPRILFWTADPEELEHITHVTPQVDLDTDESKDEKYPVRVA